MSSHGRVGTEGPWARQESTGPLGACTASPTPWALLGRPLFPAGTRPLRGTKGCPSQSRAAADVPHRVPHSVHGRTQAVSSLGGYTARPLGEVLWDNDPAPESSSSSLLSKRYPTAESIILLQVTSALPTAPPSPRAEPALLNSAEPRNAG